MEASMTQHSSEPHSGHSHHDDHHHDDHHHGHEHGHEHGHAHAPPQPDDKVHSYYQILGVALKELLIEKGVVTADEVRAAIEARDAMQPANGAKVVARAWVDPAYRERLLKDANAATAELGFPMHTTHLVALENTDKVHNVVVCTLCSCYPRELLGLPPSWYKSKAYRARIVREPRAVLEEFGTSIPGGVEVRVRDSTADLRYLVVPQRPAGTEGMDEEDLAKLVSRDAMIGVATVKAPAA
jgi:nitrile hydratase subunit alpha